MRCHDCLQEFAPTDPVRLVLKKSWPTFGHGLKRTVKKRVGRYSGRIEHYTEEHVCADCAQWYGDEAVEMPDEERRRWGLQCESR